MLRPRAHSLYSFKQPYLCYFNQTCPFLPKIIVTTTTTTATFKQKKTTQNPINGLAYIRPRRTISNQSYYICIMRLGYKYVYGYSILTHKTQIKCYDIHTLTHKKYYVHIKKFLYKNFYFWRTRNSQKKFQSINSVNLIPKFRNFGTKAALYVDPRCFSSYLIYISTCTNPGPGTEDMDCNSNTDVNTNYICSLNIIPFFSHFSPTPQRLPNSSVYAHIHTQKKHIKMIEKRKNSTIFSSQSNIISKSICNTKNNSLSSPDQVIFTHSYFSLLSQSSSASIARASTIHARGYILRLIRHHLYSSIAIELKSLDSPNTLFKYYTYITTLTPIIIAKTTKIVHMAALLDSIAHVLMYAGIQLSAGQYMLKYCRTSRTKNITTYLYPLTHTTIITVAYARKENLTKYTLISSIITTLHTSSPLGALHSIDHLIIYKSIYIQYFKGVPSTACKYPRSGKFKLNSLKSLYSYIKPIKKAYTVLSPLEQATYPNLLYQYSCILYISLKSIPHKANASGRRSIGGKFKPILKQYNSSTHAPRGVGTFYNTTTQPLLAQYIGNNRIYITQPLISKKISTTSEMQVFLRYRSIKANTALKSPKYGRTLKLVANPSISQVFSVNPLSRTNCRGRRTFLQHLTAKTEIKHTAQLNAQNDK